MAVTDGEREKIVDSEATELLIEDSRVTGNFSDDETIDAEDVFGGNTTTIRGSTISDNEIRDEEGARDGRADRLQPEQLLRHGRRGRRRGRPGGHGRDLRPAVHRELPAGAGPQPELRHHADPRGRGDGAAISFGPGSEIDGQATLTVADSTFEGNEAGRFLSQGGAIDFNPFVETSSIRRRGRPAGHGPAAGRARRPTTAGRRRHGRSAPAARRSTRPAPRGARTPTSVA